MGDGPGWLGIDFSGNDKQWSSGKEKSNVWIARIEGTDNLRLTDLKVVQRIEGVEHPFDRLVKLLRTGNYLAAAIDAPFSVPARYLPRGGYRALLRIVDRLPTERRPFPSGAEFKESVVGNKNLDSKKPLRETEKYWQQKGIAVRSTLWDGPRKGTAMTAACLKLIAQAAPPIWPWRSKGNKILVEAFPAAQLCVWGCPYTKYNGSNSDGRAQRKIILGCLSNRLQIEMNLRGLILDSADALDSVVCAFAALAVSKGSLYSEPPLGVAKTEGWIAVHQC